MNLTVLSNDENDIRFLYVNLAAAEPIDLYRIFDWQGIVSMHSEERMDRCLWIDKRLFHVCFFFLLGWSDAACVRYFLNAKRLMNMSMKSEFTKTRTHNRRHRHRRRHRE